MSEMPKLGTTNLMNKDGTDWLGEMIKDWDKIVDVDVKHVSDRLNLYAKELFAANQYIKALQSDLAAANKIVERLEKDRDTYAKAFVVTDLALVGLSNCYFNKDRSHGHGPDLGVGHPFMRECAVAAWSHMDRVMAWIETLRPGSLRGGLFHEAAAIVGAFPMDDEKKKALAAIEGGG